MYALLRGVRTVKIAPFRQAVLYTVSAADSNELRTRIMVDIKAALKAKDLTKTATLRSVLADIRAADKAHKDGRISISAMRALIAKGIARRNEAASKYSQANRPDLAAKESQEVEILQGFLPPGISESQIDEVLKQIIDSLPLTDRQHLLGQVLKAFYAQVDKSLVRPDVVKLRAQALLAPASSSPS